jgi:hypothetical protein
MLWPFLQDVLRKKNQNTEIDISIFGGQHSLTDYKMADLAKQIQPVKTPNCDAWGLCAFHYATYSSLYLFNDLGV